MKTGTPNHPKMVQLCDAIQTHCKAGGLPLPHPVCLGYARGIIESLIHFTAAYSPAGDIGKHSDGVIATAICWPFDAAWLIQACLSVGWIDEIPGRGRLYLHDWHVHCEDSVHMKLARSIQPFANWKIPKFTRLDRADREKIRGPWRIKFDVNIDDPIDYVAATLRVHGDTHTERTAYALAKPMPGPFDTASAVSGEHASLGSPPPATTDDSQPTAGSGRRSNQRKAASGPAECDQSPPVMTFPVVGKGPTEWPLTEAKLAEYRLSFPGIDPLAECRSARQWCIDNRPKRKTFGGMAAFLTRWLTKAQNERSSPRTTHGARGTFDPSDPRGNLALREQLLQRERLLQEINTDGQE